MKQDLVKQRTTGWRQGWSIPLDGEAPMLDELRGIRERGFEDVEVRASWATLEWQNGARLETWARRLDEAGLCVHSLHAGFEGGDLTSVESQARVRSLSRHKRAADVLHSLGGSLYVVDLRLTGERSSPVAEAPWLVRAVRGLTRLSARCKERGLSLVVRICLPERDEPWEVVEWIFDRLPAADEVGLSIDVESDVSRGRLLELAERQRFPVRRVEVQEHTTGASAAVRSYWQRLEDVLRRGQPFGLFLVKPSLSKPARSSPPPVSPPRRRRDEGRV